MLEMNDDLIKMRQATAQVNSILTLYEVSVSLPMRFYYIFHFLGPRLLFVYKLLAMQITELVISNGKRLALYSILKQGSYHIGKFFLSKCKMGISSTQSSPTMVSFMISKLSIFEDATASTILTSLCISFGYRL